MAPRPFLFLLCFGLLFVASPLSAQKKSSQRAYDRKPAPAFVFRMGLHQPPCQDRTTGVPEQLSGPTFTAVQRAPYLRTRLQQLRIPRADLPALTVTADLGAALNLSGQDRDDWSVSLCAQGDGQTETEALDHLRPVALQRTGGTLSLGGSGVDEAMPPGRADLDLVAPRDAPVTLYASYAPISVRDMTGPLHILATHGRIVVVNVTGRLDATGYIVDYAGSSGHALLNATREIDLMFTAACFDGTLSATAGRALRVLLPRAFATPFQVRVRRRDDFVCRTALCSSLKPEKTNGWYIYTYPATGSNPPAAIQLLSEQATVVLDELESVPERERLSGAIPPAEKKTE